MMYLRPPSVEAAFFLGCVATGVGRGMGVLPPSPQAGFRALCGPKAELALINPSPVGFNSALHTSHFLEWADSISENYSPPSLELPLGKNLLYNSATDSTPLSFSASKPFFTISHAICMALG